ncbi:MAG: tRNA (adenosine(37)-N6)-dimethylallyltransferase MiaA [Armatimonadetes bacterium]|nr:tRNA (adenosine(37)-N6)-dimethylallyltransferase MiaA [Armatimonadota bacterium]MDW8029866.1 tRNA (adenosine(37)-N6)-dimethylallyltransferase MiaA [Armatimonadota bacterium]
MAHPPLLVILGPTAVGKTEVSISVAESLGAEIVSCDSVAVYRYMDIGSAKPNLDQRKRVPHYLLDVVYPDEPYNVAMYVSDAEKVIERIWRKGKIAMVVGGTSLYLSSLLEGFDLPIAPPNEEIRRKLLEMAEREGSEALHRKLKEIDPFAAQKIHPHDVVRLVRALEVYWQTGKPISSFWHGAFDEPKLIRYSNAVVFGLICQRFELFQRIETRMHKLLQLGWLEEIRNLLEMGYSPQLKSLKSLGYREFTQVVLGNWSLEKGQQEYLRCAKAFAKRQWYWFKKRPYVQWVNTTGKTTDQVAEEVLKLATERFTKLD